VRRSRDRASRKPARSSSCTTRFKVRCMFRTNASASHRVQCVCRGFGTGKVPRRPGNRPRRQWSGVPSHPHVGRTCRCQAGWPRGQRRPGIPCGASGGGRCSGTPRHRSSARAAAPERSRAEA
jgi:hypothetical protein